MTNRLETIGITMVVTGTIISIVGTICIYKGYFKQIILDENIVLNNDYEDIRKIKLTYNKIENELNSMKKSIDLNNVRLNKL